MIRTQARIFLIMLNKLIEYLKKHGGNRDTYLLNKLTQAREEFYKIYGVNP